MLGRPGPHALGGELCERAWFWWRVGWQIRQFDLDAGEDAIADFGRDLPRLAERVEMPDECLQCASLAGGAGLERPAQQAGVAG